MQLGNWVPISKSFVKDLPVERAYTELEAMFSLTLDYDNSKHCTVTGYMALWGWSKGKVLRFFERVGASISYPEKTDKKRNQTGLITIHKPDLKRTNNGLKRMIDSKWLAGKKDLKRTNNGLKTDLTRYSTKEPNPETDPNPKNIEKLLANEEKNLEGNDKNSPPLKGEFQNVKISEAEYKKLISSHGQEKADDLIERLSAYMESSGKRYKSHYATLLAWARRDSDAKIEPQVGTCRSCKRANITLNQTGLCRDCARDGRHEPFMEPGYYD